VGRVNRTVTVTVPPKKAPASAMLASIRPFQAVSTLSSRPGLTRSSRASNRIRLPRSTASDNRSVVTLSRAATSSTL